MKAKVYTAILLTTLPFLYLFTQAELVGGDIYALANILGQVGTVLMLWQFALGIRFVSSKFEINYTGLNKIHQNLGKYGIIFIILHPYLQTSKYGFSLLTGLRFVSEFEKHVSFGKFAYYLFLIVWFTSAVVRKKIKYRPWVYIHYLTYPMLFFVFIHAPGIGTFINSLSWVSLYWNILTLLFFALLVFRILNYLNLFKTKAKLISKRKISNSIHEYVFSLKKNLDIKPGQYFYIRDSFFGEAQPYSVMEIDKKKAQISFGIKSVGKHSRNLEKLKKNKTCYLDGPYGTFTKQGQNDKYNIIFAGGVGVTPFVEFVKRFGKNSTVFYSVKSSSDLVKTNILSKYSQNYYEIVTSESGHLDEKFVKNKVNNIENAKIFICGPVEFMSALTEICLVIGADRKNIFKEEFEF